MKPMKPTIEDTILVRQNVGKALEMLRSKMSDLSIADGRELLDGVEADYNLMCGSLCHGVHDPKGDEVYAGLLRRTYRLYNIVRMASIVRSRAAYSQCKAVASGFDPSGDSVRKSLEGFVQELAMVSLLSEGRQAESAMRVRSAHQSYIEKLFCSIVTSEPWNHDTSSSYLQTILSPTVDQNDAILMVSAVTLSLLTVFDVYKWTMLSAVYESSSSEQLRQRALVGLALTMPSNERLVFPEINAVLKRLCSSEVSRRELLELQMQIFYCSRTMEDSERIQRDIMPTIMKNSDMKVTRTGIVERDDSADDILDYGATDRNISEMEEKIAKMMDMQKAGSDIYFGGFSRMKRFPFFSHMCNWFLPFSLDHPDVARATLGKDCGFLRRAIGRMPFCDSDKYSFAIAFASVVDRLPGGMKNVLSGDENVDIPVVADHSEPAYIRRMYLQDLYRFFMLYDGRADFPNPLSLALAKGRRRGVFFASPLLRELLPEERSEVASFMFRQRQYSVVAYMLSENVDLPDSTEMEMLALANSYMRLCRYEEAYDVFSLARSRFSGCSIAVKGLADAAFMLHRYSEAADLYGQLTSCGSSSVSNVVYHSLSLINSGHVREGLGTLFKLDYEDPTNLNVKRAIAWGYLMDMKPEEAERLYDMLMAEAAPLDSDILNGGYAKWLQGKTAEAVDMFKRYSADGKHNLAADFIADKVLLDIYGVKRYERTIVLNMSA